MSSTHTNDYRDSTGAFKYAKNENLLWPLQNVLRQLSISRTTWLMGVKAGRFPQPVRLSERKVVWRSCDIITLIDRLAVHGKTNLEPEISVDIRTTDSKKLKNVLGELND